MELVSSSKDPADINYLQNLCSRCETGDRFALLAAGDIVRLFCLSVEAFHHGYMPDSCIKESVVFLLMRNVQEFSICEFSNSPSKSILSTLQL